MWGTFNLCSSLVNAPDIPNSVTNMNGTFNGCSNLTGNIYIHSNQVSNATNCFYNTSLTKNVYIPFTYENNTNTQTYNSFIAAGYDTAGTINGVYLKNINEIPPSLSYSRDIAKDLIYNSSTGNYNPV